MPFAATHREGMNVLRRSSAVAAVPRQQQRTRSFGIKRKLSASSSRRPYYLRRTFLSRLVLCLHMITTAAPLKFYVLEPGDGLIVFPSDIVFTDMPTSIPTYFPTDVPTGAPTDIPTDVPTDVPTWSRKPTKAPTSNPTKPLKPKEPTNVPTTSTVSESPTTTIDPRDNIFPVPTGVLKTKSPSIEKDDSLESTISPTLNSVESNNQTGTTTRRPLHYVTTRRPKTMPPSQTPTVFQNSSPSYKDDDFGSFSVGLSIAMFMDESQMMSISEQMDDILISAHFRDRKISVLKYAVDATKQIIEEDPNLTVYSRRRFLRWNMFDHTTTRQSQSTKIATLGYNPQDSSIVTDLIPLDDPKKKNTYLGWITFSISYDIWDFQPTDTVSSVALLAARSSSRIASNITDGTMLSSLQQLNSHVVAVSEIGDEEPMTQKIFDSGVSVSGFNELRKTSGLQPSRIRLLILLILLCIGLCASMIFLFCSFSESDKDRPMSERDEMSSVPMSEGGQMRYIPTAYNMSPNRPSNHNRSLHDRPHLKRPTESLVRECSYPNFNSRGSTSASAYASCLQFSPPTN